MGKEIDVAKLKEMQRPLGLPFRISKIGHVVLNVTDLERSIRFYTQVLGFSVCDIYPDEMAAGGMAFMRYNADHHGIALVGSMPGPSDAVELNHVAFEVGTLDEVIHARDFLKEEGVEIDFEGRRRAGSQISVEFRDPDGHRLEIYWDMDQVGSDGITRPPEDWKWALSLRDAILNPVNGQDTSLLDPTLLEKETPEAAEAILARTLATHAQKFGRSATEASLPSFENDPEAGRNQNS